MMQHQIQLLCSSSDSFSHKINQNYMNCSLIGKNIIDVEVYLVREMKTLKGSYSYDSLMVGFKNSFESCQKLFSFLKLDQSRQVQIVSQGLSIEISQSGLKTRLLLSLSSFKMTEKETMHTVIKLLEQNSKLTAQIEKQAHEHNILMNQMLKESEQLSKSQKPQQKENQKEQQEQLMLKQNKYANIIKTKIIKKDRQEPKQYHRYQEIQYSQQAKVTKECEMCKKIYQGREYFRWCLSCFDRNKQFIKRF